MLNFFKHSYISQQVAVVLMALVLWMPAFITKSAFVPGGYNTPLYNIIISLFDFSPLLLNIIAFAVYLFCIFLFNSVLSANRLVSKYSTVGALSFLLMMCCSPELHSCYPLGLTFLFGDINVLISSYSSFFNNLNFYYDLNKIDMILLIIFSVLFLISLLRVTSNKSSDKGSNIRKRVGVALILTVFAVIMFFLHSPAMNNSLIFMMFAFFYAMLLSDIKKSRVANIVMISVIIFIVANQYLPLFGINI